MNINAQQIISIDVSHWSEAGRYKAIRALNDIAAEEAPVSSGASSAWQEVLNTALLRLAPSAMVQAKAIRRAIENGSRVTRAEVYELGGYEASRSLKGFTRPCNRVTKALKDEGLLPRDAPELLAPVYDSKVKGYQQAKAFTVPDGLVWTLT